MRSGDRRRPAGAGSRSAKRGRPRPESMHGSQGGEARDVDACTQAAEAEVPRRQAERRGRIQGARGSGARGAGGGQTRR